MRAPARLWRDLGAWRFAGFQVLFLGTLSQFLLAPVFWALAAPLVGLPSPIAGVLPAGAVWGLVMLFALSEAVTLMLNLVASRRAGKGFLMPWVPTLHAYFPLATFAAYKALYELVGQPFYWDKTAHGLHDEGEPFHPD